MDDLQRQMDAIRRAADIAAPFRDLLKPSFPQLDSVHRLNESLNLGIGSEVRKFLDAVEHNRSLVSKLAGSELGKSWFQIDHFLPTFSEEVSRAARSANLSLVSSIQNSVAFGFAADAIRVGAAVRASLPNFGSLSTTFEALSQLEREYGREFPEEWSDLPASELINRLESVKQSQVDSSSGDKDEDLDRLQTSVDEGTQAIRNLVLQAENAARPWTGLGRDIALNLIFGVLFMLMQNIMDQRDNEEAAIRAQRSIDVAEASLVIQIESSQRMARIEDMQRQMLEAMADYESTLDAMPSNGVVMVRTALRQSPDGRHLDYLDAGHEFVVLAKNGKWIEVRFKDGDGQVVVGWLRKKHCKAILY